MEILTSDFQYNLPDDRIALFPSDQRDHSKLLAYQSGTISHDSFLNINRYIKTGTLLIFNNSKVIPARILFKTDSGARIELLLLTPYDKNISAHGLWDSNSPVVWNCTIGNKKRWRDGVTLNQKKNGIDLFVRLLDRQEMVAEFSWDGDFKWSEVLQTFGDVPLPPYIKREANSNDRDRYQTVYSKLPGAIAAPTAGLHFTDAILEKLESKGITCDFLTLHVSAGTFRPIKVDNAIEHNMHKEEVFFTKDNIDNLFRNHEMIIPVGTTSCRSIESLYWYGIQILQGDTDGSSNEFSIDQSYAYQSTNKLITRLESLEIVRNKMEQKNWDSLHGSTSIYIYPGYQFRMTDALITNFHQPGSTLLLLIAALIGNDWKRVYAEALSNGYRFLSYGDSSLLVP